MIVHTVYGPTDARTGEKKNDDLFLVVTADNFADVLFG